MDNSSKARVGVLIPVLMVLVLAMIGTEVGFAQTTDSEEIFACAHKESGALRVVADLSACRPSEQPLSWNREGSPGTVSLQVVSVTTDVPTSEQNRNSIVASALCPSGMNATGGGFLVQSGGIYVKASRPIGNVPIGWQAIFAYLPDIPNPPPPSTEVTVWAVCTVVP